MTKYYKYLPFGRANSNRRKWTMDVFKNSRLYLGHYEALNDPMESFFDASELTRKQMYIFANGGTSGLNDEMRLIFDSIGARVTER